MGRSSQPKYIISFYYFLKMQFNLKINWRSSTVSMGRFWSRTWKSFWWELTLLQAPIHFQNMRNPTSFFLFLCFMVSFYSSPFFRQPAPAVHTPATQCTTKAIGSHFQCLASQTKAVFSSSCETSCSLPDCSPQGEQDVGQTYCTKTKRTVHY